MPYLTRFIHEFYRDLVCANACLFNLMRGDALQEKPPSSNTGFEAFIGIYAQPHSSPVALAPKIIVYESHTMVL
jgi:hypothetical protein